MITTPKIKPTINEVLGWLDFSGEVIVAEIGAANGDDSLDILNATNADQYYAFEPDPRNLLSLKQSGLLKIPEFNLIPCAIGNRNSIVPFNLSSGYNENLHCEHTFSSSVKKPVEHLNQHPWCKFDKQINVRMIRLDDFCQLFSIPPLSLIWCDVQGAEDLVIEGAQNALRCCHYLYTEYYDTEMYEGQLSMAQIYNRLPGKWKVFEQWEDNVLFENKS